MPQLASIIEKAADAFAREIIAAVKAATLQELLAMQGGAAPGVAAAKRRGRPPKAKSGRPAKAAAKATAKKPGGKPAKKIAKKAAKTSANKKRLANYPKCSVPGCGKNRWARGNGMCGEHFKASKAGASA